MYLTMDRVPIHLGLLIGTVEEKAVVGMPPNLLCRSLLEVAGLEAGDVELLSEMKTHPAG